MKKTALLLIALCFGLITCDIGDVFQRGSLILNIYSENIGAKTIVPDVEMVIASYDISGSGPDSQTFSDTGITETTYIKNSLKVGAWSITVAARNASGEKIAEKTTAVAITAGETTTASITVIPVVGQGTLSLTLSWPALTIINPSINATLTPNGGSASPITFTIPGDSASYFDSTLSSGYYTLAIELKDGSTVVWGLAEAVRILAGEIASADIVLTLDDINPVDTGDLQLNLTDDLQNPIEITFTGAQSTLVIGADMTVTANPSVTPDSYQWYLTGGLLTEETSASITIGSALSEGNYRLDVVIEYGSINSSGSVSFSVYVQPPLGTWANVEPMSVPRNDLAAAVVNGKVYVVGGDSNSGRLTLTEEYDPASNTWTTKASMSTARNRLAAAAVGGIVYAIGGYNGSFLSIVEAYNPATDTWTTKAPMPTPRYDFSVASVGEYIYAIGGGTGSVPATPISTVERYDPSTDTWTTMAPMPTVRAGLRCAVVDEKIYVSGGGNTTGLLNTFEVYDTVSNTWEAKQSLSVSGLGSHASAAVLGKVYIMGGNDPSLAATEMYDPATDMWTSKTSMNLARSLHAIAATAEMIYVFGGVTFPPGTRTASVEVFDPLGTP